MEDKNRGHATLPQGSGASSSSRALPPAKRWRGRISAAQAPAVSDADDSMQDASSSSGVRPPAVQDADDNVQSLGSNSVAPAPAPRTRVPKKDAEILAAVRVLTKYPRQLPRGTKPANEEERKENAPPLPSLQQPRLRPNFQQQASTLGGGRNQRRGTTCSAKCS